ncbi:MAG: carboxymuconolactone decarboxylase family protein [Halobacteriota archaeon]|nr:carboxymuconolactone decarboxylase family protein [Halobacteriota archaeon]
MKKVGELSKVIFKDKEETVEALLDQIEEQMGMVPLIFEEMSKRPEVFVPNVIRDFFVLRFSKALDLKTAELIAVASAASLRSEGCLKVHIGTALKAGATMDEIFDVIMISSVMAQTSRLGTAFRVYQQFKEEEDQKQ